MANIVFFCLTCHELGTKSRALGFDSLEVWCLPHQERRSQPQAINSLICTFDRCIDHISARCFSSGIHKKRQSSFCGSWISICVRGGNMKRIALGSIFVVLIAALAGGQTFRGAISGTVTDPSGGVVPNAQVKATDVATAVEHNTTTTTDGAFVF